MRAFLAVLAVVALASCSDTVYLVITPEDAGKTFEVAVETPFQVQLPSNPSTGFGWAPVQMDGVEFGSPQFVQEGNGVGAGGYEKIVVTATKPGSYFMMFEYSRPWEDVPPEQVFTVVIEAD